MRIFVLERVILETIVGISREQVGCPKKELKTVLLLREVEAIEVGGVEASISAATEEAEVTFGKDRTSTR